MRASRTAVRYRGATGAIALLLVLLGAAACANGPEEGEMVEVVVPPGAGFGQVVDSLEVRGLVRHPLPFRIMARIRGDDRRVRSGTYLFPADARWSRILDDLVAGRAQNVPLTIPEGFTLNQMAPRMARVSESDPDSVLAFLEDQADEEEWGVPGPGLEGYLFPDTYHFSPGSSVSTMLRVMTARYQQVWTDDRRARAEELGMSEQEVMTLASIIEAEARRSEEMEMISSVFHNRLRLGYPLQADPTVLYALGGHRDRLLYAAIDSVADHPYNTYTQPGLPPGPIGASGEAAVDAALHPRDTDYLYFVARPDGRHIFTRSLQEHNRARALVAREWDEYRSGRENH